MVVPNISARHVGPDLARRPAREIPVIQKGRGQRTQSQRTPTCRLLEQPQENTGTWLRKSNLVYAQRGGMLLNTVSLHTGIPLGITESGIFHNHVTHPPTHPITRPPAHPPTHPPTHPREVPCPPGAALLSTSKSKRAEPHWLHRR